MRAMQTVYDLHTHSTASDGTLSPSALVGRARACGVHVLALTDHDTTAGIDEARRAAGSAPLALVAGVEISVTWQGGTVHVLGLHIDPANEGLQAGLARLQAFRRWRAEEIGRRLAKAGIDEAHAGARALAQGQLISRTHFARFLVEQGHAPDVRTVFKRFLVQGKPGHVPGRWAALEEAVEWIRCAGGLAVLAHPARYRLTATKLRRLVGELSGCGGEGIEVHSGSHGVHNSEAMAALARRMHVRASSGSDFHGPEHARVDLGGLPPLPSHCRPVWESPRWPVRAPERAMGA